MSTDNFELTLVIGAQRGDRAAEDKLVRKLRPELISHFKKRYPKQPDRAEDAAQEALILIFQNLGMLEDPERFCAWAFAIARNVYVDATGRRVFPKRPSRCSTLGAGKLLGREKPQLKTQTMSLEALEEEEREKIPARGHPLEEHYLNYVDPANHAKALCRARGLQGAVFLAIEWDDLTHRDAQEKFGINSESTCRSHHRRCRKWLEPQMSAYLGYVAA